MHPLTCVIPTPTNPSFFKPKISPLSSRSRCYRMFFDFSVFFRFHFNFCSFRSLMASLEFKSLPPFVNPSKFSPSDLTLSDYKNVVWPGSKHNAVCVMFGAVQSCNIIHSTTAGPNKIRALSIIPSSTAFDSFNHFLWKQYDAPELYGPFDYGCLLTFTSRHEGLTSSCSSYSLAYLYCD